MDQPLTKLRSYSPASAVAAKSVVERPDTTLLAEVASLISILTGKPVEREHAARLADGFAILDAYGRITFANPHFARHLGLGLEAVVGADLLADTPAQWLPRPPCRRANQASVLQAWLAKPRLGDH